MSVAEMKLAAINEITKIDDELVLKAVLEHLTNLSIQKTDHTYNLSQHFEAISQQYGAVLEKLAK